MYFSFQSFRARLIRYLDVDPDEFDEGMRAWMEKNGSVIAPAHNYLCDLYYSLIDNISRTSTGPNEKYIKQRFVYGELYAYKCYHDEDCTDVLKQMHWCDLQIADAGSIKVEAVIRSGKCCSECDKQDGRILSIEEALLLQPLPNPACLNEDGCTCTYGFHSIRDKDNHFLKNDKIKREW